MLLLCDWPIESPITFLAIQRQKQKKAHACFTLSLGQTHAAFHRLCHNIVASCCQGASHTRAPSCNIGVRFMHLSLRARSDENSILEITISRRITLAFSMVRLLADYERDKNSAMDEEQEREVVLCKYVRKLRSNIVAWTRLNDYSNTPHKKCCEESLTILKLDPTPCNILQQSGQTRTARCFQECCNMLRWNVARVWSGPLVSPMRRPSFCNPRHLYAPVLVAIDHSIWILLFMGSWFVTKIESWSKVEES